MGDEGKSREALQARIKEQGDKVRKLKEQKAEAAQVRSSCERQGGRERGDTFSELFGGCGKGKILCDGDLGNGGGLS